MALKVKAFHVGDILMDTYEPYDRHKLGKKRSDKRSDYKAFPSLDWPPK